MKQPFKAGDYVVRMSHGTNRVKFGKVYQVVATTSGNDRPRICFTAEGGHLLSSCPSLYRPATEGEINMHPQASQCVPAPSYPAPPVAPVYMPSTQVTVEEMRALADRVEAEQQAHEAAALAAKADRDERLATNNAINEHKHLADATITLLGCIRRLLVEREAVPQPSEQLAKHRKALAGLAEVYGVKIVLVGDKTTATVVKA